MFDRLIIDGFTLNALKAIVSTVIKHVKNNNANVASLQKST